jgi:site-specific recombinase XerD
MSDKPISPLRQRMLEDMSVRRFVPDTQREYIRAVKRLATFLGRSPDSAIPEELRAFQLHLTETGVQPPTINATVTALRFFFKVTLDRPETTRHLVFVYEPRKLPRVLSPEEVLRLLEAAPGPKHKAALSVSRRYRRRRHLVVMSDEDRQSNTSTWVPLAIRIIAGNSHPANPVAPALRT